MLKIKDNVDLKVLEKYGFIYEKYPFYDDNNNEVFCYVRDCLDNRTYLQVWTNTKEIALHSGLYGDGSEWYFDKQLDILYDLIQAGLVEKVGN